MGMFVLDFLWLLLFIEAIKAETNSLEFGFWKAGKVAYEKTN
jgi:hypothetical protein